MQQNIGIPAVVIQYINRSQTHECGNWGCGRAISFLGIFVSNFLYWFFAVYIGKERKWSTIFSMLLKVMSDEKEEGSGDLHIR
jgi:hypothetical protein